MSDEKNLQDLYEEFRNMETTQRSPAYYDPMQGDVSYNKGQVPTASPGGQQFATHSPAPGEMEEDDDKMISKNSLLNYLKKLSEKFNAGGMMAVEDCLKEIADWADNC